MQNLMRILKRLIPTNDASKFDKILLKTSFFFSCINVHEDLLPFKTQNASLCARVLITLINDRLTKQLSGTVLIIWHLKSTMNDGLLQSSLHNIDTDSSVLCIGHHIWIIHKINMLWHQVNCHSMLMQPSDSGTITIISPNMWFRILHFTEDLLKKLTRAQRSEERKVFICCFPHLYWMCSVFARVASSALPLAIHC